MENGKSSCRHGSYWESFEPKHRQDDVVQWTQSNFTSLEHKVTNSKSTNIPIIVACYLKITDTAEGLREINWKTDDGYVSIKISNMIVVQDLSMRLHSITSSVNKNIAMLFMLGKAFLIDLEYYLSILGYASQEEDLFYIDGSQYCWNTPVYSKIRSADLKKYLCNTGNCSGRREIRPNMRCVNYSSWI